MGLMELAMASYGGACRELIIQAAGRFLAHVARPS